MMATLLAAMLLTLAPQDSIDVRVLAMTDFHGAPQPFAIPPDRRIVHLNR